MAIKAGILGAPVVAMTAIVVLLNRIDADSTLVVAGLTAVAVAGGSLFGFFADRLPGLPRFVPGRRAERSRAS
ncbi:MAG TPA: hypothetical protein VFU16_08825 [Solirubrobacterales bacterium]|nr:hypothetical protein [Solirubrobacterales bacterium]